MKTDDIEIQGLVEIKDYPYWVIKKGEGRGNYATFQGTDGPSYMFVTLLSGPRKGSHVRVENNSLEQVPFEQVKAHYDARLKTEWRKAVEESDTVDLIGLMKLLRPHVDCGDARSLVATFDGNLEWQRGLNDGGHEAFDEDNTKFLRELLNKVYDLAVNPSELAHQG